MGFNVSINIILIAGYGTCLIDVSRTHDVFGISRMSLFFLEERKIFNLTA
jgi:hypothetical protein